MVHSPKFPDPKDGIVESNTGLSKKNRTTTIGLDYHSYQDHGPDKEYGKQAGKTNIKYPFTLILTRLSKTHLPGVGERS